MKKLIVAFLFLSFSVAIAPLLADSDPKPTIKATFSVDGLSATVTATASTTCGEVKTTWCKNTNPGKGTGIFEVKWGDGAVTCSDLPASHTYDQPTSYPARVRIQDTCGYVGEYSTDLIVGAIKATTTATSTDVATSTETATTTKLEMKCAKEGEMTSGPVSPEFQFGCCAGLESMRINNLLGSGNLCYDPANGIPKCGTDGWRNNNGLLKSDKCIQDEPVMCTKEYMPVCGELQVQCIKAPCPPIKQTYGNKCELGAAKAKLLYDGVCKTETKTNIVDKKAAEKKAQEQAMKDFKKMYGRVANMKNQKDAWSVKIMTVGIGKIVRNIAAENQAIKRFVKVFGRMPKSASDWNIVKAFAYSGVKK